MKWSIKDVAKVSLVVAALSVGMLAGPSNVFAQDKSARLAQEIQGSWVLVSIYNESDGKKTEPFGPSPRGSLILTPDGRFSMMFVRAGLPKFASNNRMKGTAAENEAVVQGSIAYFGGYSVASGNEQAVTLHTEGSTFPNWDGQDQKRLMTVSGNEMKLINQATAIGGTNYQVWKRVK